MRHVRRPIQLFLLCVGLIAANASEARSIKAGAWQSMLESADFVGVVECKRAAYPGPKIGQYHCLFFDAGVHDDWKNASAKQSITIVIGTSDPHFDYGDPKPEVGKRYFLFGSRRWSSYADPPPAGADYESYGGLITDVDTYTPSMLPVNFKEGTWAEFKVAAQNYFSLPDADRELERLKASLQQSVTSLEHLFQLPTEERELLAHAPKVSDLLTTIFESPAYGHSEWYRQAVWEVLTRDGGSESQQAINACGNLSDLVSNDTLERYRREVAFREEKRKSFNSVANQKSQHLLENTR